MSSPKVFGPEEGGLSDLKQRLSDGEKFSIGRKPKKAWGNPASPDDFREEPVWFERQQKKTATVSIASKKSFEEKLPQEYNCTDMWRIFQKFWVENNLAGFPISWTNKERGIVKRLIVEQGSENIAKYFEFCCKNWKVLSHRLKISSLIPTIPILYGFRRTLLPEALNPTQHVSQVGAEYVAKEIPSGSWS